MTDKPRPTHIQLARQRSAAWLDLAMRDRSPDERQAHGPKLTAILDRIKLCQDKDRIAERDVLIGYAKRYPFPKPAKPKPPRH